MESNIIISKLCFIIDKKSTNQPVFCILFLTEPSVRITGVLQKARLEVLPQDKCIKELKGVKEISPYFLCAGRGTPSTCSGDSGSPLLFQEELTYYQIGITSIGMPCDSHNPSKRPNVFPRITSYMPWILDNIKL